MKHLAFLILIIPFISCERMNKNKGLDPEYILVIHGGAGVINRASMDAEMEKSYRDAMEEALSIGEKILSNGGSSLDAVEAVVVWMEDNPLFNAGKGSVFTHEGRNEMDASIMSG